MAKKFTPEQTLHLVTLYREHECLWNIHSDIYKNPHFKNRALQKMCVDLNIKGFTVQDLKTKIKTIRSTYCIELDKIEKTAGTEFVYKPRVIWFDALNSFIRDVTMRKKRATDDSELLENVTQNSESEPIEYKYSEGENDENDNDNTTEDATKYEDQDPLSKAYEISLSEASGSTAEPKKRKIYQLDSTTNTLKLIRDGEDDIEPILKIETGPKLRRIARKQTNEYPIGRDNTYYTGITTQPRDVNVKQEDEFDTFGKHVANQLRQLSTIKYILAQEEIQSTITKYRMDDING